jgi:hypothetical protein
MFGARHTPSHFLGFSPNSFIPNPFPMGLSQKQQKSIFHLKFLPTFLLCRFIRCCCAPSHSSYQGLWASVDAFKENSLWALGRSQPAISSHFPNPHIQNQPLFPYLQLLGCEEAKCGQ